MNNVVALLLQEKVIRMSSIESSRYVDCVVAWLGR